MAGRKEKGRPRHAHWTAYANRANCDYRFQREFAEADRAWHGWHSWHGWHRVQRADFFARFITGAATNIPMQPQTPPMQSYMTQMERKTHEKQVNFDGLRENEKIIALKRSRFALLLVDIIPSYALLAHSL